MIRVLEQAIEKVRDLPVERQEAAAEVLRVIAAQPSGKLTAWEVEGVRKARKEVKKGKFASDKKVKLFFARFRA
jgi:hypothetical protein